MKLLIGILVFSMALCATAEWYIEFGQAVIDGGRFVKEATQGTWDMGEAYVDLLEGNFKNSDKYFHARGNYEAAQRGPGGKWAAEVISDARELFQSGCSGGGNEDSMADQEANRWGRQGGDPNRYRPAGLPDKY